MSTLSANCAFLMIDIQNDFCPGGALAVNEGDQVVAPVNAVQDRFQVQVLTQDWHPADHTSFAVNHEGAEPFSMITLDYGDQVLWPAHCVQGTEGAAFHPQLRTDRAELIVRKGFRAAIDSYSAFFENDRRTRTGLAGYLKDRGVTELYLAGLATDYCVYYSAMDAVAQGFKATLLTDCCRAIDLDGSLDAAMSAMGEAGVSFTTSDTL